MRRMIALICLLACSVAQAAGLEERLASPDGNVVLTLQQKTDAAGKRALYYSVHYGAHTVIRDSLLELRLDNHLSESAMALPVDRRPRWFDNLNVAGVRRSSHDSSWKPVTGEAAQIRDHYQAMTVELVKDDNPVYKLAVEVRAYNEGVAFRFAFPENEKGSYYRIIGEDTEFALPAGTRAWYHGWAQAPYKLLPLRDWPDQSERPLTLELPNGLHVALLEAQMTDYARTKFKLSADKPDTLVTAMHDAADLISPFATPWRGIMIARTPGELAQNNHFILNLNPPSRIADSSWIKPGKIMRVMTQTTAAAKANIDFAARHKLEYILFDWKWYGPAFSFDSDATKVAIPDFDLPAIIAYAKERGIGVWLYVNQQALLTQSDTLFQTYRDWGIKGVKFGFVQVGSHRWTTWVEKAIQQAAAAGIMVNIHDDWRPTGEQRTWPNLMTSEGIRGNEEMPDATHNTVLPFTRFLAGAADYTICYYDPRIKTTHAHQLALAVVYYSPLQTLYWYDKPEMSQDEPELAFWDRIPTVWDETRVLDGAPGRNATIARRSGNEWYIGAITNNEARTVQLKLDFLPAGQRYEATIYADDAKAPTRTKVGIRKQTVDARTVLPLVMLASGGQALWLRPIK
ncbi:MULTISPECIES: glycoside hydrolase family 97 protein [unclassified Duganella]|uniref:glycoside hydrolase family 97 protein n=1 Tax=unclassified Duganella TaxID=2636909 RepID=UPI00088A2223|nr:MULTISPECIES: glycoside hydrolase family 97 protein [unclassified Duganella]SDF66204.1 alpha-glucosidase [Duganella sp. OV458]SDI62731.1 alpha-glucosidase [Duganella sp. OV510]